MNIYICTVCLQLLFNIFVQYFDHGYLKGWKCFILQMKIPGCSGPEPCRSKVQHAGNLHLANDFLKNYNVVHL
jgi:hypothetical protein